MGLSEIVKTLQEANLMITLPKEVYEVMTEHAKKEYPQEACGFVVGKNGRAEYFLPLKNIDRSSVTYSMDPKEQIRAFKKIDEDKQELLGIFHSHVASQAYPSQTDRKMAFYPEVSYLIVSLVDMEKPDLKSYRIVNDGVTPEEVVIQ